MKSKIGLILTWGMIISGALGFIVFGNKEGRFKYYQDGLSITIQNQTNQPLQIDVLQSEVERILFSMNVAPRSIHSVTNQTILLNDQDISVIIDYKFSVETQRLQGFPYIDSMETKYVLELEFNEDGEVFSSGLGDGRVILRSNVLE